MDDKQTSQVKEPLSQVAASFRADAANQAKEGLGFRVLGFRKTSVFAAAGAYESEGALKENSQAVKV